MGRPRGRPPKSATTPLDHLLDDAERPLTRKERKFLDLYLDGGDIRRAALESGIYRPRRLKRGKNTDEDVMEKGYRPNAIRAGMRVLKRAMPQIEMLMEQEGMSLVQLMRKLSDGLEASTAMAVSVLDENGVPQRGEGGKFMREVVTVPDHRNRTKYLEMAFKLRNAFPAQPAVVKVQGGDQAKPIQVQHMDAIESMSEEEKKRRLDELIEAAKRGPLRIVK